MSRRKAPIDLRMLEWLLDQGLTPGQLAERFGVSTTTLWRRMREVGIDRGRATREPLPPIPERTGYEDRLKLEYIREELASGKRTPGDEARLRQRYREILRSANPDPPGLAERLWAAQELKRGHP
jgi:hypothetical protein